MNAQQLYDYIYEKGDYAPHKPKHIVKKIYVNPNSKKYFHVVLDETRELMNKSVGSESDSRAACLYPMDGSCLGKLGNIHFCLPYFKHSTILHECLHAPLHTIRRYGFSKIDLSKYSMFEERLIAIQEYLFLQITKELGYYITTDNEPNAMWEANAKAYKF